MLLPRTRSRVPEIAWCALLGVVISWMVAQVLPRCSRDAYMTAYIMEDGFLEAQTQDPPPSWVMAEVGTDVMPDAFSFSHGSVGVRYWIGKTRALGPTCFGVVESGWPLRSFEGRTAFASTNSCVLLSDPSPVYNGAGWPAAVPAWLSNVIGDRLLCIPLPGGLAVNTMLYGSCCFLVFGVVRSAARWRRDLQGRCPLCGYDLRGLPGDARSCPECGAAARSFA